MVVSSELPKCEANYSPLTPITFLERVAAVYPERTSVIYGDKVFTWAQTIERCRRLASAVRSVVSAGDTVAVLAPNTPAMYELHFGVPMANTVLNTLNTRLDVGMLATILGHSEAKLLFVDIEYMQTALLALENLSRKPTLILIEDDTFSAPVGAGMSGKPFLTYEAFLKHGDPKYQICWPADEWESISINYTSGTTSHPKGVVYHHRGAYLNSLVTIINLQMPQGSVYLWTLPMFHCNGWLFPWAIAAVSGTNICLRAVTAKVVFAAIVQYRVTHMAGAPVVLNMIASAAEQERKPIHHTVNVMTGGAPPPAPVLSRMESMGFVVSHGYGLTESFAPATFCTWKPEWDSLPLEERARLKARQGVATIGLKDVDVLDPETMTPVPRDGKTMGEVMMKGPTIMKGYWKDQEQTDAAFKGGWFHTGDIGVIHPDNYISLKDRSKDIIISGGENISSIEVESVLFRHPQILEAAVVARPDEFWGETPVAFVTLKDPSFLKPGPNMVSEATIVQYCRENMAKFMVPRTVVFQELPKTVTGKVQKSVLRDEAKKLLPTTSSKL